MSNHQWNYLALDIVKEIWNLLYTHQSSVCSTPVYSKNCSHFRLTCKNWSTVFDRLQLEEFVIYPQLCNIIISRRKRNKFFSYTHLNNNNLKIEFPKVTRVFVKFTYCGKHMIGLGDFSNGIKGIDLVQHLELTNLPELHYGLIMIISQFHNLRTLKLRIEDNAMFRFQPINNTLSDMKIPPHCGQIELEKASIEGSGYENNCNISLPVWIKHIRYHVIMNKSLFILLQTCKVCL